MISKGWAVKSTTDPTITAEETPGPAESPWLHHLRSRLEHEHCAYQRPIPTDRSRPVRPRPTPNA